MELQHTMNISEQNAAKISITHYLRFQFLCRNIFIVFVDWAVKGLTEIASINKFLIDN